MKLYQILPLALAMIFSSCSPVPSSSHVPSSQTTATREFEKEVIQTPASRSPGDSASPVNTLDVSEAPSPPAEANPFVRLVKHDLANRLKISADQIHFLKITDIDWQDLTQGCTTSSRPTLTKGRVFGYRIWLEANGKHYLYHIGLDNTILACPE